MKTKNMMTACCMALLAAGFTACGGQKKAETTAVSTPDETTTAVAATAAADSVGYIVKVGDMAPDFTMTLTDGSEVTLSALRGKLVMLQFTASWCGVCRKEMPFIESDIWQRHKDNANFVLMGVDRDEPLDKVQDFAKSTGITYPLGLDPGADIFALYAVRDAGITRNVLIDPSGKIVKLTRLYNEEEFASLVAMIDRMLATS
ncbi:MAG: TlpA family protein disulfide reductase [Prevotellaceae bacterium]|jgi:peroxiredoxin|nr:TlpA family protein disulfide reductase [Prevotellaceae bacterium]